MEVFKTLNAIDVNAQVKKKGNLTYLSWAWAWGKLKDKYPCSTSKVYEREDGRIYWDDGKTAWVKVGVTVNGLEHVEYLPIMDHRNQSIKLEGITSFNVNNSIQRALTKAIARHGLGLYIYAGEDLPPDDTLEDVFSLIETAKADDPDGLKDFMVSNGLNSPGDVKALKKDALLKLKDDLTKFLG